jgi:CBS domain-containing protein
MQRPYAISAVLVIVMSFAAGAQEFEPLTQGRTNVENLVSEMFFLTRSSGSLTLHGTCQDTQQGRVVVSESILQPPKGPFTNLDQAMTMLSRVVSHLSWSRDAEGLVRVSDDRVIGDVLRVRLKRLHFAPATSPEYAIQDFMAAPEVRSYLKENGVQGEVFMSNIQPASTKGLPEFSGDVHNVTVAQALDGVMKFFPGLWIYSECTSNSGRRVIIRGVVVAWPGAPASGARQKQDYEPR